MKSPILVDVDGSPVLAWRWPEPVHALSSAAVGGGFTRVAWLVNIEVPVDYSRTDLETHLAEVADRLGFDGPGIGLFTAAQVERVHLGRSANVVAHATVGLSKPTWAADPGGGYTAWRPGTINLVIAMPVALTPAAAVNAIITATEAKTQALFEASVPGTGTASDAIVVVWPAGGEQARFAGPRSRWGSALALATHHAVADGTAVALADKR